MDYFDAFIKECIKDLKNEGTTIVYFEYQIDELKKRYPNLIVKNINDEYFEIMLNKIKVSV